MSISVVSYNVLASAYITRGWYRRTPAMVLDPAWRVPSLVQYVTKLDADLFCLQEVEPESFVALRTSLLERGFDGEYARKLAGRPEGLAVFYRRTDLELTSSRVVAYRDRGAVGGDSGYIAHFVLFRYAGKTLGVINTHLTWDPPGTALAAQRGLLQIQQLLAEYATCSTDAEGWILCGDFNVTPDSAVVDAVAQAGFQFSHRGLSEVFSCNIGSSARLIDYIFFSPRLSAKAAVLTRIDDQTILPSADEPSDHVPVKAAVTWQS